MSVMLLQAALTPGMTRCYEMLNLTSRSFAAVIQSLDEDLRYVRKGVWLEGVWVVVSLKMKRVFLTL